MLGAWGLGLVGSGVCSGSGWVWGTGLKAVMLMQDKLPAGLTTFDRFSLLSSRTYLPQKQVGVKIQGFGLWFRPSHRVALSLSLRTSEPAAGLNMIIEA